VKRVILDTCTFVWLVAEPSKLGRKAKAVLGDADTTLVLSDATVWEICLKWSAQKIKLPEPPSLWIEAQAEQWRMQRLPIDAAVLYRTVELPLLHQDPFDRLLIAQAVTYKLAIVTPDKEIAKYPVATVWG
jgi:PIN domain nuclease of toxin-antitoxin system